MIYLARFIRTVYRWIVSHVLDLIILWLVKRYRSAAWLLGKRSGLTL